MPKSVITTLNVRGEENTVLASVNQSEYTSITNIAKYKSDVLRDVFRDLDSKFEDNQIPWFMGATELSSVQTVRIRRVLKKLWADVVVLPLKKWIEPTGAIGQGCHL